MTTHFRQHPGSACEECRRRKARCDRARPRCGTCGVLGKHCVFNETRTQRGPKKGQIRALRDRVNTLERLLAEPQHEHLAGDAQQFSESVPMEAGMPLLEAEPEISSLGTDMNLNWGFDTGLPMSMSIEPLLNEMPQLPHTQTSSSPESIWRAAQSSSEDRDEALMRDDLVAVYFERVHPTIPIIHKLRFFDSLEHSNPSSSQRCLHLAVQATAAASTAQTLKSSHALYTEACTALDHVEINGPIGRARGAPVELEYIQALLLITYYEALRMPQNKYVITAGKAFRLVQIARLHEIDIENSHEESSPEVFAAEEERRRAFWGAYTLDRLLSIRHDLPHTFHDVSTHTRLPAPESSFQDCTPTLMPFLCDAMANLSTVILPVSAECIVLATLQGRSMLLRGAPTSRMGNVCAKLQDIRMCLHQRLRIIAKHLPKSTAAVDPTLGFMHVLAHSLVITLSEIAEGMAFGMSEQQKDGTLCLGEAFEAYGEIVRLARSSCRLGRFKTHLFLPILLSRAINFIINHVNGHPEGLDELMSILQRISYVNRQAEELVHELGGLRA